MILALGLPGAAQAQMRPAEPGAAAGQAGTLTISGAWARATPPAARTGAVYLTVTNDGGAPDRLVAGASSAAASVEFHAHMMDAGVARMRAIEAVEISPGEPAIFQPGGLHVMLIDLRAPLREGQSIPLTLTFARAGTITLDVPVRRTAPPGTPLPSHQHEH